MIARLILVLALFVIAIIAVTSVVGAAKAVRHTSEGDWMPDTFQRIAYILLIVLMFGICTGLLGAV